MENTSSKQGSDQGVVQTASCFRKTVGEEATFMDRFRQFRDAPAAEHWSCLKSKVRSVFGEPTTKVSNVSAVDGVGAATFSKDGSK